MSGLADFERLGFIPLRHHTYAGENYEADERVVAYGAHVRVVRDPDGMVGYTLEDEDGVDTAGDILGGSHWRPSENRGTGAHAFAWPAVGSSDTPGEARPALDNDWAEDFDYREKSVSPPPGIPRPGAGDPGLVVPGSRIDGQDDLWLPTGGPLISDDDTPGEYSSTIADVEDGVVSDVRRAKLQHSEKVAFSPLEGDWMPARNFRATPDGRAGRGLFAEDTNDARATSSGGRKTVLGHLAHLPDQGGPIMADDTCAKHVYGEVTRDGETFREQAGHISTDAHFKVPGDPERDAPVHFSDPYFETPQPHGPVPHEAEIRYDRDSVHEFDGGLEAGRFRVQYWSNDRSPEDPTTQTWYCVKMTLTGVITGQPGYSRQSQYSIVSGIKSATDPAAGQGSEYVACFRNYSAAVAYQQLLTQQAPPPGGTPPPQGGNGGGNPPPQPPGKRRQPPPPPPPPDPDEEEDEKDDVPPEPYPDPPPPDIDYSDLPPPSHPDRDGVGASVARGAAGVGAIAGGEIPDGVGSEPAPPSGESPVPEGESYEELKRKIIGEYFRGEISKAEMERRLSELFERFFGNMGDPAWTGPGDGEPAVTAAATVDDFLGIESGRLGRMRAGGQAAMQDLHDVIGGGQPAESVTETASPSFSVMPMPVMPEGGRGEYYPNVGSPYEAPATADEWQRFNEHPRGLHMQAFTKQDALGNAVLQDRLPWDRQARRVAEKTVTFVSLPEVDIYDRLGHPREDSRFSTGTFGLHKAIDFAIGLPDVNSDGISTGEVIDGFRLGLDGSGNPVLTPIDDTGATDYTKTLTLGEYAIPLSDGTNGQVLQTDGAGSVSWASAGGGSGDVVGPSGATDNALARFDTATGKLLQDSPVTLTDAGNMSGVAALATQTIELGHASDTTLSRGDAGVLHVEGVALLRADQNLSDVASAATARGNLDLPGSYSGLGGEYLRVNSGETAVETLDDDELGEALIEGMTSAMGANSPAVNDELLAIDVSTGGPKARSLTLSNLFTVIPKLVQADDIAWDDEVPYYNNGDSNVRQTAFQNIVKAVQPDAIKTTDQTYTSDNSLNNDNHLSVTLDSGGEYIIDLVVFVQSTNNPDFKFDHGGGTATFNWFRAGWTWHIDGNFTCPAGQLTSDTSVQTLIYNSWPGHLRIKIGCSVSSGGTLVFRHAQQTSHGDTTGVLQGSWIKATRVS